MITYDKLKKNWDNIFPQKQKQTKSSWKSLLTVGCTTYQKYH